MSSETKGWTLMRLPALAEEEEEHEFTTPFGRRRFVRRQGEPLNPERLSAQMLAETRDRIGAYNFSAQYQQRPVPVEGVFVRPEWLQRFNMPSFERGRSNVYQSWDTATKAGELNDFSVCTTWAESNSHFFLLDVFRRKLEYPDLREAAVAQFNLFKPDHVLVEDKASGTQLIQELKAAGLYSIEGVLPDSGVDKIMRFRAVTPLFASGRVHVPTEAPWLSDYLDELFAFPGSKYDDQIDATAYALNYMRGESDNRRMWERLAD